MPYYRQGIKQEAETLRLMSHCAWPTHIVKLTLSSMGEAYTTGEATYA